MSATPSALRSTMVVSATRGVAAVLTLASGVLSARYFGTTDAKDSFLVAQAIPNLVSTFLIGGLYSTLLVNLADIGRREGARGQRSFARRILGRLALGLVPVVALVLLVPGVIVRFVAPGFTPEKTVLTASLLRYTVLGAVGVLLIAGIRCVFEARGQFVVPAFVSLVNPLVSLIVLVALVGAIGIYTLAVGPLVGLGLSMAFLVLAIPRHVTDPPGFVPQAAGLGDAARLERGFWMAFIPMSLGANFGQINVAVDNAFASYLPTGSITMLGFAFVIVSNAQLLTTLTLAEVSFSRLAANATASRPDLQALFRSQVRHMILITTPLAIGTFMFSTPLVRTLFERGAFSAEATAGVAAALRAYAPGMFFLGFLTLFSVLLTSQRRFARIAVTATVIIVINGVLDLVLMKAFGLTGIAVGTTLTIVIHAALLALPARRILGGLTGPGDLAYGARVLLSAAIMGVAVAGCSTGFERFFDMGLERARIAEVVLGLSLAACVYVGALLLFRVQEAKTVVQRCVSAARRYVGGRMTEGGA